MYVCGPTVYDYPHIGHGRAVLTYDIFRRFLTGEGYKVEVASNITDIEDKIINRSKELGVPAGDITRKYEAEWYKAMDALGARRPHHDPHATAYVDDMVELIATFIERGFAYETSTTVYFDSEKIEGYGLLARQTIESLKAGSRVEPDEEKRSPIDFALWKKIDPASGEPTWPSPWGAGRPGWHTECVVMALDLLGDGFDIHAGGLDLCFPHHENERAQAIAWGRPFARHWMHHGFIEVGGEKMSKSLGNFTSLTDLIDRYDPRAYRLLLLRAHYRSPIEVTNETMTDAQAALGRLDEFARRFAHTIHELGGYDKSVHEQFRQRMCNDLDTPNAMAVVFGAVRDANAAADEGNSERAEQLARTVGVLCGSVGLFLRSEADQIDEATELLMRQRDDARAAKDWAQADAIRNTLQSLGWVVEDTAEGTKVHR